MEEQKLMCAEYKSNGFCKNGSECPYLHKEKYFNLAKSLDHLMGSYSAINGMMVVLGHQVQEMQLKLSLLKYQNDTLGHIVINRSQETTIDKTPTPKKKTTARKPENHSPELTSAARKLNLT